MVSVKTPHCTPLRFITSSITIKHQWLTLDHWACPLNGSPKDSGGFKKIGWKNNEIIKKSFMAPFYGCCSTASRLEPLWRGSLLYNTKSPEIPGIYSFYQPPKNERLSWPWSHPMVLTMRILDWESSTLTTRPLKLTPSFPKCWIEKNRTIQYAAQ